MGLFDGIFKNKPEKELRKFNWIPLTSASQLENLTKKSVLFKHSTRCGISSSVLHRFEKKHLDNQEAVDFYYLDLLNFRGVSNTIAEKFQIVHQSPQAVVIADNAVIAHASHYDILELNLAH